jgi:hypothetical protein
MTTNRLDIQIVSRCKAIAKWIETNASTKAQYQHLAELNEIIAMLQDTKILIAPKAKMDKTIYAEFEVPKSIAPEHKPDVLKTLSWYADPINWKEMMVHHGRYNNEQHYVESYNEFYFQNKDGGHRAREVLERIAKGDK